MGFLLRWMCAFVLLAATYNPTPYNYLRWTLDYGAQNISIAVLVGLLLLIGYIIYLRATLRSIGGFGMTLVLALVGAILWVLYDFGVPHFGKTRALTPGWACLPCRWFWASGSAGAMCAVPCRGKRTWMM